MVPAVFVTPGARRFICNKLASSYLLTLFLKQSVGFILHLAELFLAEFNQFRRTFNF